jgi:hypothetical protein
MMPYFFFRRTQLGGYVSFTQEKRKIKPFARWFQRQLMWLCGVRQKVFHKDCDPKDIDGFLSQGENDADSDADSGDSSSHITVSGEDMTDGEYSDESGDEDSGRQQKSIYFYAAFGTDMAAALWL